MTKYTYLTNKEILNNLALRNDLTEIEHELVDRLTRALEAMVELEDHNAHNT